MLKEPDALMCAQEERTERAKVALAASQFCIAATMPDTWVVQNGDKLPYTVRKSDEGWSCTCQDYQRNGELLRCKHIEAVRLSAANKAQIHKEVVMSESQENVGGWVKLYHPAGGGVQVTLPVPPVAFSPAQAQAMFSNVSTLMSAGFMVNLPGLEEGETRESVTHIVRRRKAEDGGGSTPIMDIYAGGNFRVLSVYLDAEKEDETKHFVELFGAVNAFPLFRGNAPIERGKDAENDKEFVVNVADRGAQIVYKANPKYSQEEADRMKAENKTYKVPKRVFVRFEKAGAVAAVVSAPAPAPTPTPAASTPTPAPAGEEKILTELGYAPERIYLDGTKVNGNVAEQDAYDSFKKLFSAAPASKEALRKWIANGK